MGLATSCLVSFSHGLLAFGIVILLWLYNSRLKGHALIGNTVISLLCGISIYFAEWPGMITHTLIPFIFAFLSNLAREIIKDIQDIDGDIKAGLSTLPIYFGVNTARKFSGFLLVLILLLLPFPVFFFDYHISFLISACILVIIPLLKALYQINSSQPLWMKAQKNLKLMMLGGMLAIVLGKLL